MLLTILLIICSSFQCVDTENENQKRLLLHSGDDVALEFQKLRQEMEALRINHTTKIQALKTIQTQEIGALKVNYTNEMQALQSSQAQEIGTLKIDHTHEIQELKSTQGQEMQALKSEFATLKQDQGSTYVRWGKTACNGNGTENVYSGIIKTVTGFTSGSPYDVNGGAASYVCLPQHPTWAKYVDGIQNIGGYISGTEYQIYVSTLNPFPQTMDNQDAPCVLCRSPRPTTVMIPGRTDCYPGWTMEYTGYLMTGHHTHKAASDYACVDVDPEAVYHGEADQNGKLLYLTEVKCGSLPCQEYPDGRELACVVCSK